MDLRSDIPYWDTGVGEVINREPCYSVSQTALLSWSVHRMF